MEFCSPLKTSAALIYKILGMFKHLCFSCAQCHSSFAADLRSFEEPEGCNFLLKILSDIISERIAVNRDKHFHIFLTNIISMIILCESHI